MMTMLSLCAVSFTLACDGAAKADHQGEMSVMTTSLEAEKKADIVDTAVAAGSFQTLVAAVQAAGLVDVLKGEGPFTVFAPTDDAFAELGSDTINELLKEENRDKLVSILTYHVVAGRIESGDAVKAGEAATVQGGTVTITVEDGQAMVNGANIVAVDIDTSNGVIHVIDSVLIPE